jgi:arsenate reductase-like glutaredoxin family protein
MSFTLYNAPQSTCSQRVRFVLNAKKISFAEIKLEHVPPQLNQGDSRGAEDGRGYRH